MATLDHRGLGGPPAPSTPAGFAAPATTGARRPQAGRRSTVGRRTARRAVSMSPMLALDLSDPRPAPTAGDQLPASTADVLVNNAGFGTHGDWSTLTPSGWPPRSN